MKAQHLRIGNWVTSNGLPIKVRSINDEGINIIYREDGDIVFDWYYSEIRGIPLTEEILLKCGFVKKPYEVYERQVTPHGLKFECAFVNGNFMGSFFQNEKIYIQYLHELQNFLMAITGEELNIEL